MSNAKNKMPAGAALAPFEAADYLRTPEEIAVFLEAVFADYDGDSRVIVKALGTVAKAHGMSKIAEATGMSREGLYQALSGKGNPSFDTVLKVIRAVDVELKPATAAPVVPEAVIIKGHTYRRVTLGPGCGWTGEESEAFVAGEHFPEKSRKRSRRSARITGGGVMSRSPIRKTGKSITRRDVT